MDMPLIPGLVDGAGAPTLAELLGSMSDEDVAALNQMSAAPPEAAAEESSDSAGPEFGDEPDPTEDEAGPEEQETPVDEAAETPEEQRAEADANTELHSFDEYAGLVTKNADAVYQIKGQVDDLLAQAEEHTDAGLDTGAIEDAVAALEDAAKAAQDARDMMDAADPEKPEDLSEVAGAAHAAENARVAAEQALAAAKASIADQVGDLVDPGLAALQKWAQSLG